MELPKLRQKIEAQRQQFEENQHYLNLQEYQKLLNASPEKERMEKHPLVEAWYLPISHIEMLLDELFFGLWQTKNFKWSQVENELTASIELEVLHPVEKVWLKRTGAAAKKIMMDAPPKSLEKEKINEWHLNLNNKKPSALDDHGGFSSLKSDAFKNAALSLGKYFGRDINREHTDKYSPIAKDKQKEIENKRNEISKNLEALPENEAQEIIDGLTQKEQTGYIRQNDYDNILNDVKGRVHKYWEKAKSNMTEDEISKFNDEQKIINHLKQLNNGQ